MIDFAQECKSRNFVVVATSIGFRSLYGSAIFSSVVIYDLISNGHEVIIVTNKFYRSFLLSQNNLFSCNTVRFYILPLVFSPVIANTFLRLLFNSLLVPLRFPRASLLYVEDYASLIPSSFVYCLFHNPTTFYSTTELQSRNSPNGIIYSWFFKRFQWLTMFSSRPFAIVQSTHLEERFKFQFKAFLYKKVISIDPYHLSRYFYPNLINSYSSILCTKHQLPSQLYDIIKNFTPGKKIFLCPFAPRPQKGFKYILKLASVFPSAYFLITSTNEQFESFLQSSGMSKLNNPNIVCCGSLAHIDLLMLIKCPSISCVIFPSTLETFGLPIMESYFLNKVVLFSDDPVFDSHYPHDFSLRYKVDDFSDLCSKFSILMS